MAYRSTDKTRQKKDAKRTAMMQTAVRVFAEKGYHAATIRDIVKEADVAIGTFYFYFPDKETLFVHLYEETADFFLQTINQSLKSRPKLADQIHAGLSAYVNIALYEPAVIHLLLVGGAGTVPSLAAEQVAFRQRLTTSWRKVLDAAEQDGQIPTQDTDRTAKMLIGGFDEVVLHLLQHADPEMSATTAVADMVTFTLRAVGYIAS